MKPMKRDWLREAQDIVTENSRRPRAIKREHLEAVMMQVSMYETVLRSLESRIKVLYDLECERRKAAGLPPPPTPPLVRSPENGKY